MQTHVCKNVCMTLGLLLCCVSAWSVAQERPMNTLEIFHTQLQTDKKVIVTKYMELTDAEGQAFWPIYDNYQQDLQKLLERLGNLLQRYETAYRDKALTDAQSKQLLDEWIAIEQAETQHRATYAAKLLQALPAKKAARYLQIENEYRLMMRYDLAVAVPLAQ